MRFARITAIPLAVLTLSMIAAPRAAFAQAAVKVAIANPVTIFNELQETKDLRAKLDADVNNLEKQRLAKAAELKDAQDRRNMLNASSPEYAKLNRELLEKSTNFEVWMRMAQADMARQQKMQIKALYDKIITAIETVAKGKQLDLVLAQQSPEVPTDPNAFEQMTPDQLRQLLGQRNVLYNSALADISQEVIATMNKQYTPAH
jgi:Skp family chaperone for outer membrane proteins